MGYDLEHVIVRQQHLVEIFVVAALAVVAVWMCADAVRRRRAPAKGAGGQPTPDPMRHADPLLAAVVSYDRVARDRGAQGAHASALRAAIDTYLDRNRADSGYGPPALWADGPGPMVAERWIRDDAAAEQFAVAYEHRFAGDGSVARSDARAMFDAGQRAVLARLRAPTGALPSGATDPDASADATGLAGAVPRP